MKSLVVPVLINVIIFLLGGAFTTSGIKNNNSIYISIGCSLFAGGVVYLLDILRKITLDDLDKNYKNSVLNVIFDSGIKYVHRKRSIDKYDDLMTDVKEKIDISGYSLRSFFENSKHIIQDHSDNNKKLSVRMLVVDPDSEFSIEREKIEAEAPGTYKNSIGKIKTAFKDTKSVEIRKINTQLTTMIYRIDDLMFVGPHFYQRSSTTTNTLELSKAGWLFGEYIKEFENLWKAAKPI